MSSKALIKWLLPLGALLACNHLAIAAEAPPAPQPVIPMTKVATDPANYAWLSDGARKALTIAISQHKAGAPYAFVFAGAPGSNSWDYRTATKASDFVSVADIARQSLEVCEYYAGTSCFIVSVNGFDVRDAGGGMPVQPYFLRAQPTEFDPRRVPFSSATNWSLFNGYLTMHKAKAFVVDIGGDAWWKQADDVEKAIAGAYADCHKAGKDNVCFLYAVNNRVVFAAGGPY